MKKKKFFFLKIQNRVNIKKIMEINKLLRKLKQKKKKKKKKYMLKTSKIWKVMINSKIMEKNYKY